MTVQSTNDRVSYVANGAITIFDFDMKSFDPNWISVYEDGILSVATITKTLDIDQELNPGGQIIYAVAPLSNVIITILRTVSLDQLIDYSSYSGFPAQVSENGLDKLTFIVQQLLYGIDRSIRQNNLEADRNMVLPSIADRSLRLMYFDQDGNVEAASLLGIEVALEAGVETLVAGLATVVFANPKVDVNYVVTFGGTAFEDLRYFNKTINGFEIASSNSGSNFDVDWMALS